ncbi:hypothetical protein KPGSU103_C12040 [Klebsiella pneumoniae]|nr:hypothetical protein KPGSU103_C12040 [Klebsiella pneumoniae]
MHHDASLNIRQLQVFEAVARLESYSRAQQELGISVSAISNAMSQLGKVRISRSFLPKLTR